MAESTDTAKQAPSQGGEKSSVAPAEKPAARRYTRAELLADSRALTGVQRHVLVGAFFEDEREEMTRDSARKLVSDFLGRDAEVHEEDPDA